MLELGHRMVALGARSGENAMASCMELPPAIGGNKDKCARNWHSWASGDRGSRTDTSEAAWLLSLRPLLGTKSVLN